MPKLAFPRSTDPRPKVRAIQNFVSGLVAYRRMVADDAVLLMNRVTLDILADRERLRDFLEELAAAVLEKHLLSPQGKVRPAPANLVHEYVAGMMRRSRK
jgi:hypothetical protein